jgi:hypothetical protein
MKPMVRMYPRLRLHSALRGRRGITVEQAVERATVEMNTWSEGAFDLIDAAIADIRSLCSTRNAEISPTEVLAKAEEVVTLAGLFSPPLCRAAQSLCALALKSLDGAVFDRVAITVHVESMVLLRALGSAENATSAAILDGLHAVVAKAR